MLSTVRLSELFRATGISLASSHAVSQLKGCCVVAGALRETAREAESMTGGGSHCLPDPSEARGMTGKEGMTGLGTGGIRGTGVVTGVMTGGAPGRAWAEIGPQC